LRARQLVSEKVWRERYHNNQFEQMLTLSNIKVIKFSPHFQRRTKRRLESRLQDPDKRWKFSSNDLKERLLWDDYQKAFEDAINNCSTAYALVRCASNNKWYRNL